MNLSNILIAVAYVSNASVVLPMMCYSFAKNTGKIGKVLFSLLVVSLLSDTGSFLYYRLGLRGYIIANIFFASQFILLSLIYITLLTNRKWVYFSLAVVLLALAVNCAFFQSIHEYQTVIVTLESILLLSFTLKYFVETYHILPAGNLMTYFPMWINLAVFLYFGFNLFLFAIANYIFKNAPQEIGMIFWGLHNFNNIVKNLMFAAGIYLCFVKKQDQPSV